MNDGAGVDGEQDLTGLMVSRGIQQIAWKYARLRAPLNYNPGNIVMIDESAAVDANGWLQDVKDQDPDLVIGGPMLENIKKMAFYDLCYGVIKDQERRNRDYVILAEDKLKVVRSRKVFGGWLTHTSRHAARW